MMTKLNMTNFKYADGNATTFDGYFGKIELIYRAETTAQWDLTSDETQKVPSYFDAFLFVSGQDKPRTVTDGRTAAKAVENLYSKHALYLAMEDTGLLDNNPQNQ